MILWTCTFSRLIDRNNRKEIQELDCPDFNVSNNSNNVTYSWTGQVYRLGFLWDDWAYYISQDLFFTFLIWFWSIFFVAFSLIALSIKSFKLWSKK